MDLLVDKVYVLYIYEKEKKKFLDHYNRSNCNFKFEFFLGVNGNIFSPYFSNLRNEKLEENRKSIIFQNILKLSNNKKLFIKNEKQLGHIRAFIKIFKDAKKNNFKKICILESDALFHKNFNQLLQNLSETISNSKLFYLGSNDTNIKYTTNLMPFNPENTIEKIKKKNPKISEEKLNLLLQKNKNKYITAKKNFSNLIKTNSLLLEKQQTYIPLIPYGTFAMIIDNSIFELILQTLSLQIFPTDVLFFHIQSKLNQKEYLTAFPNLIIADVSHSYILQDRDPEKFAETRGWNMKDYIV